MIIVASSASDPFNESLVKALGDAAIPLAIPHGDAIILGVWEDNRPVRVLIERKRVLDFINSVLGGHHLQQVQDAYSAGFDFQWLIVEGDFRPSPVDSTVEIFHNGRWRLLSEIRVRKGQLPSLEYRRLDDYLNQCELYLGVRCKTSRNVQETARMILDLYYLFQKPPEQHGTLKNLYQQAIIPNAEKGRAYLMPPTLLEKVALQLPGVGWERAKALAAELKTLDRLCEVIRSQNTTPLVDVPGIGKKTAEGIIKAARGEG